MASGGRGLNPPEPIVKRPGLVKTGGVDPGTRPGRGFSLGELREAGLDPKRAAKLGIYVDKRRRTVHPWNVEALKRYLEALGVRAGQ